MKLQIVKKKVASRKAMEKDIIEINTAKTLRELLIEVCKYEYHRQHEQNKVEMLKDFDIIQQAQSGRVSFKDHYNQKRPSLDKAIQIMLQDFDDGLFRVFIEQNEVKELDDWLNLHDLDECVFLRLVMLAGRLW